MPDTFRVKPAKKCPNSSPTALDASAIGADVNTSARIHTETADPSHRRPRRCIGTWSIERGQVWGSLPVGLKSPKRTSATPWPSVPGSQAAITASLDSSTGPSRTGRPERTTVTTGTPASLAFLRTARSFGGKAQVLAVAHHLGIRPLADHDEDRVGPGRDRSRRRSG